MPRRDELETIFDDARQHLDSLPDWKITSETRREIARLSATAVGGHRFINPDSVRTPPHPVRERKK